MSTQRTGFLFVTLAPLALAAAATGQCADFASGFGALGVAATDEDADVRAQVVFDDGSGEALYAGGVIEAAGDVATRGLARWNGQSWRSIGDFTLANSAAGTVNTLAIFDAGSGDELYAGGVFDGVGSLATRNIARWNGTSWSPLAQGLSYPVRALISFDDGNGAKLYAACGGAPSGSGFQSKLAVWDGASWTSIEPASSGELYALEVFDDGTGAQLYVGGYLVSVGGTNHSLLKWTGSTWVDVGGVMLAQNGYAGAVLALETYDDGAGNALYVGGNFIQAGVTYLSNIAKWNGSAWSALGTGISGSVQALATYDDGQGRALFAGGTFTTAGGTSAANVARWKAGAWSQLSPSNGVGAGGTNNFTQVHSFASFDDGAGEALFVGGRFGTAGGQRADCIARWSSSGWSALGVQQGLDDEVSAIGSLDVGGNTQVLAAGRFTYAGSLATTRIAKWDGSAWAPTPGAPNSVVRDFERFDDGNGEKLFAVDATRLMSWDGTQWSNVPGSASDVIEVLERFDDGSGPALWCGGEFTSIAGIAAKRIARWDGSSWSAPATGPNIGSVYALAAHDDGSGPALYVGGSFTKIAGQSMFGIARWNGATWSPVGSGFDASVYGLAVFDDGSGAGPELYACGVFVQAPPYTVNRVARWNGFEWRPLGTGLNDIAQEIATFDDGFGLALYVGHHFENVSTNAEVHVERWNGASWSAFGAALNGGCTALRTIDDLATGHSALWIGGRFTAAGSKGSSHVAVFARTCPCPPQSYCTAGTSSNGCTPTLSASGSVSASGASAFLVTAQGVEGQKPGLVFYGVSGAASSPWGATGFLCVKAPQQRTTQSNSGGTSGACDGALVLDWNAYMNAHPSALGQPFQAGNLVWLQGWYRDPPSTKTTALTDALACVVCP
jgi:hypothetical protein